MAVVIGRFAPQTFAILRIMAGIMFTLHGTQKALGWPPMKGAGPLPPIAVVAGWLELILGVMIVIGLFTGLAAFIASGEMAVAYFTGHAPKGLIPIVNQGELAVLYCFLWLYVAAHGAGIWSVDAALRKQTPVTS